LNFFNSELLPTIEISIVHFSSVWFDIGRVLSQKTYACIDWFYSIQAYWLTPDCGSRILTSESIHEDIREILISEIGSVHPKFRNSFFDIARLSQERSETDPLFSLRIDIKLTQLKQTTVHYSSFYVQNTEIQDIHASTYMNCKRGEKRSGKHS
jgi:hypothetical protein